MRRRMHAPVKDQWQWLSAVLRGHYAHYGLSGNSRAIKLRGRVTVPATRPSFEAPVRASILPDSAVMLDCTAGLEPGDPYAAPAPEHPFAQSIERPPRKLRIALMLRDHRGAKLHPECLKAVEGAAKLCQSLGHIVEEADPKLDMVALRPMNARIAAANTARTCNLRWKALGRIPHPDDVEAGTWAVYQRGLKVSGVEYIEAIAAAQRLGVRWPPSSRAMM